MQNEKKKKIYRAPSISDIPYKEKRDSSLLLKMKPSVHEDLKKLAGELGYTTTDLINTVIEKFLESSK